MQFNLPTLAAIQERLGALKAAEIEALSSRSGVPASTLWKIRTGVTTNPGIETVRKFVDHLEVHAASVGAQQAAVHSRTEVAR